MEDTKTEVLEQYDFQVNNSYRGRDARILDTDQGLLSLREYSGSQRKLQFQDSLLEASARGRVSGGFYCKK